MSNEIPTRTIHVEGELARAQMAQGLRAMADTLERGGVIVSGGAIFQPRDDGSVMLVSDLCMTVRHDADPPRSSNPSTLPADVRRKLIHARDAFAAGDAMEAHHWLYQIACPSLACIDPWAAIEGRICSCGPHPLPAAGPAHYVADQVRGAEKAQRTRKPSRGEKG
jgi:hypothetical protein